MDNNAEKSDRPDPTDLQAYLPWACAQMQVSKQVVVLKTLQSEYVSTTTSDKGKSKIGKSRPRLASVSSGHIGKKEETSENVPQADREPNIIHINAIYDYSDNLVGLKFDRNCSIPRQILQILGLIIKFQTYTSLIINQGLNKYVLHEIVNFLPNSKITDISLDNCFLREGTYYTLLENASNLKNLSLSRCRIDDVVVALIAFQLCHSKTGIIALNLSSNRITDVGAKSIRDALKLNNKLEYLNLADNMLTDKGAADIFNVLVEFPLTEVELIAKRSRHINYLRDKHDTVVKMAKDMPVMDFFKVKKQTPTRPSKPKKKGDTVDSIVTSEKSMFYSDAGCYEKAQMMAENIILPYNDSYSSENVIYRDETTYCLGNNSLALLNLSYNSLTFPSVDKLLKVLLYQRDLDRKPKGLLNCRIDGNYLPVRCKELLQIEELLETGLSGAIKRGQTPIKKKGK